MLDRLLDEALKFIKTYRYRKSSLILIVIVVVAVSLQFFSAIKIEEVTLTEWATIIFIVFVVIVAWIYSVQLPKAAKGKIGFAVAIVPETKEQQEKISSDFVITLRNLLQNSNFRYHFSLIPFPVHFAEKIQSPEDAAKILHESRCRFMVYGRARVRNIQGKETQVLDLEGIVSHAPIPENIHRLLTAEFSELFPKKILIPPEGDVFTFEVNATLVNLVATYIIGIAALVSGDFKYSQQLFERVEQEADALKSESPSVIKIRQRTPSRLAEVYFIQARACYINWRSTRASELMDEMKKHLDLLMRVAPQNVEGHSLRAIWLFVVKRDVAGAIDEIEKCRTREDITWRYNYAFLLAYNGNLRKALAEYKRAKNQPPTERRTLLDIENFISWVLEKEPDKTQLHFCLGCINFFGKGDNARALLDFEKFLEVTPIDQYPEERKLAEAYIGNIHGHPNELPLDEVEQASEPLIMK